MPRKLQYLFENSSFHLNWDLVVLRDMIKAFSLKLSPEARQRLSWMDMYRECGVAAKVCRHFGIPARTFWNWKRRYDPWDLTSLESLSRRPKSSPKKTSWDNEVKVLEVKKLHPRWVKEKIGLYLRLQGVNISGKTVWKILSRHKLIVRYKTKKRKTPKPRVNWAEVHSPGDLAELDTKFVNLQGKRVYQYTFIDVASRWRYCEIHPNLDGETTVRFLDQTLNIAPLKFKSIQTDNGHEFQRVVTAYLRKKNINHLYTHKGRPIENSYVERSHRTDEEEFYSVGGYGATLTELQNNFARYMIMYNTERPHWSLKGLTPQQKLNSYLTNVCQMS